jgi:hypothetical protein
MKTLPASWTEEKQVKDIAIGYKNKEQCLWF